MELGGGLSFEVWGFQAEEKLLVCNLTAFRSECAATRGTLLSCLPSCCKWREAIAKTPK